MPCLRKLLLLTVSAALCIGAYAAEKEKKDKSKPNPAADASGKKKKGDKKPDSATPAPSADGKPPEAGETPKPAPKLSLPLPKGQDSKGVTIPFTDATGKKTMLFKIGVGNRTDEENVKMTDLTIQTFDDEGQQEMTIELPNSKMNLATRIIEGDQSVTIKRNDFQLTGKTMEFNTETKQGWIKGDVKMIIYDLGDETGDSGKPKTDAKKEKSEQ